MKTKGQHHIPRFLLNGFASRQSGKEHYTWVFRAGCAPVESNTRDVAKQKFFHGDPAASPLESTVAEKETSFASLLQRVRTGGIGAADVPSVCELVVHLAVRTKNLRDGFAQLGRDFLAVAEEKLTAPDKKERRRMRQGLAKAFREELQKPELKYLLSRLPSWQRKAFLGKARAQIAKLNVPLEISSFFELFRGELAGKMGESARNAHLRVLNQDMAPAKRVADITRLCWTVATPKGGRLVLGDVAVISRIQGADGFAHLMTAEEDRPATTIILPITPDSAITGSISPLQEIPADEVNRASVELTRDFFVASQLTDTERELATRIGTRSLLFTQDDFRQILQS